MDSSTEKEETEATWIKVSECLQEIVSRVEKARTDKEALDNLLDALEDVE